MLDGRAEFLRTGSRLTLVPMNIMCAGAWSKLGDDDEAWRLLDEAQVEADSRGERMWEPEIDRMRAALQRRRGDFAGAEASLRRALAKARAQKALPLERRAGRDLQELQAAAPSPPAAAAAAVSLP